MFNQIRISTASTLPLRAVSREIEANTRIAYKWQYTYVVRLTRIVWGIDFGDCLSLQLSGQFFSEAIYLIEIARTINVGECLVIEVVQTTHFGDCTNWNCRDNRCWKPSIKWNGADAQPDTYQHREYTAFTCCIKRNLRNTRIAYKWLPGTYTYVVRLTRIVWGIDFGDYLLELSGQIISAAINLIEIVRTINVGRMCRNWSCPDNLFWRLLSTNFVKSWKTSAVSTTVWMVETQLCKLRGTSDTFV